MASAAIPAPASDHPKQNWVVSPLVDWLFIIGTPILSLAGAIIVFKWYGSQWIWPIFIVFNTAHQFPTFIRIYGDKALMEKFRWRLLLGPVIPFVLAMSAVTYLIADGQSVERFVFLMLLLNLWDPYHFLMQHYGFMRIYDRHNAAPQKLASWMDYAISLTWFVYIMLAVADWLPRVLYDLQLLHGIPIAALFASGIYPLLEQAAFLVAVVTSLIYAGYVIWCFKKGFYVSHAKIFLLLITFAVMLLTYAPNDLIQRLLPGWTFYHGFAVLGMVHVTQYLAIVWIYNRNLTAKEGRAREGTFKQWFSRRQFPFVTLYVAICLAYGLALADFSESFYLKPIQAVAESAIPWVIGFVSAIGFTSTFLHYYYDGFIWKVRHKENRENLSMTATPSSNAPGVIKSWWDSRSQLTLLTTLGRQAIYFLPPILFLIVTYGLVHKKDMRPPIEQLGLAHQLWQEGQRDASQQALVLAIQSIDQQLEFERLMLEIRPQPKHYLYIANLLYSRSQNVNLVINPPAVSEHRQEVQKAIAALEKVLTFPEPYRHRESDEVPTEVIQQTINLWKSEIGYFSTTGTTLAPQS